MNNIEQQTEDKSRKSSAVMIGAVVAVILVFLAMVGIIPYFMAKNMINNAVEQDTSKYNVSVTAVISENLVKEKDDGSGSVSKIYTPVYEYEYNGNMYSVQGSVSSSKKKYEAGQKVDVKISADDPGKLYDPDYNRNGVFAKSGSGVSKALVPVLIISVLLLSAMIAAIAAIVVVIARKTNKAAAKSPEETEYDPNDDNRG